jgi:putative transposase
MPAPISLRMAYPSDLTDEQWRLIEPWLPEENRTGRHRVTSLREVVNAINYREQTGCPWRMLPHDFPNWGTVYRYYRRFNRDGTLTRLGNLLKQRKSAPSATSIHSPPQAAEQSA